MLLASTRCCQPPSNRAPSNISTGTAPGLDTVSWGTDGPPACSPTRPVFGSVVRYGFTSSGASVHTGKTVSGPAWTGAPRCSAGIFMSVPLPLL
jgi:hypothetical protein